MNEEEFQAYFSAMYPVLRRYGKRRLDPETADEAAIDTLRVVWQKRIAAPTNEDERRRLTALTYSIMRGMMRNSLRAERRRRRLLDTLQAERWGHPSVRPDVDEQFEPGLLQDCLTRLSATDREVLSLLNDGYRIGEIAQILGCSPGAVSARLRRTRRRLKNLMREASDE